MITYPIGLLASKGGFQTDDFVFTQTTSSTFQLPLPSGETYNFTVYWGDGNSDVITAYDQSETLHTYASAGTYQIIIRGKCGGWRFNNGGDKNKMDSIDQWGDCGFDYLHDAFYGCINMTSLATDGIKSTTITSLPDSFRDCDDLTSLPANLIAGIPNLTSLDSTFRDCTSLTGTLPTDFFRYNTSITTFINTFYNCSGITSIPTDFFRYNTAVTNFTGIFRLCIGLTSLPENLFYYNASVSNYNTAFYYCRNISLPSVLFNLSNIPTNCNFGLFMYVNSTSYSHTGSVQAVWDYATTGGHGDAFTNNTSLTNYFSIPFDWKGLVEVGTLTTDQSILQTVGVNRIFTGSAEIHWGDDDGAICSTGVEATHDYSSTGTYQIKLGAASATATTSFVADNSRITSITGLKTGLLANFRIHSNLYSGSLDLSDAPVSGIFYTYLNSGLTGITFASSGNGTLTNTRIYSCDLTGTLDLSNVNVSTLFRCYGNSNLTGITFASSGNSIINDFQFYSCDITGTFNLANIPIGTLFQGYANTNMTGITFASSGNATLTSFRVDVCDLTGTLDVSNLDLSGNVQFDSNPNLTAITFAASGGALTFLHLFGCALPNYDVSIFATSDGVEILYQDNAMSATEVDNQLINIDGTGWINGTLNIAGTNASRTSASDTAYSNLVSNGWAITVN